MSWIICVNLSNPEPLIWFDVHSILEGFWVRQHDCRNLLLQAWNTNQQDEYEEKSETLCNKRP